MNYIASVCLEFSFLEPASVCHHYGAEPEENDKNTRFATFRPELHKCSIVSDIKRRYKLFSCAKQLYKFRPSVASVIKEIVPLLAGLALISYETA